MATIKILKKRIKSAKNIAQLTKAMQMVAASKMKKSQEAALASKPYQEKILQAVGELVGRIDSDLNPLLKQNPASTKSLVILISTNKGMCGGLNSNLFRAVSHWFTDTARTDYVILGNKAENFIAGSKRQLLADFSEGRFLEKVPAITTLFSSGFLKGEYREVYVAYNHFVNSLKQEPVKVRILPLSLTELTVKDQQTAALSEFLIEPDPLTVLETLLPHYLEIQVRTAVLQAEASEHSARMIAMKNATDNALSLTDDLTLEYNRLRQEKITYEISDIVTARIAVS